ncbi:MAG TPA: hypothetical protein VMU95_12925 [Trebonia sp.]|nr:hypothetical protein [Trebonia sp.]
MQQRQYQVSARLSVFLTVAGVVVMGAGAIAAELTTARTEHLANEDG